SGDRRGLPGPGGAEQADDGVLGGERTAAVDAVQQVLGLLDGGAGRDALEQVHGVLERLDPLGQRGRPLRGAAQQRTHASSLMSRASWARASASACSCAAAPSSPSASRWRRSRPDRSATRASSRPASRCAATDARRRTASSPKIVSSSFWPTTAVAAPPPTSRPVGTNAVEANTTTIRATPTTL